MYSVVVLRLFCFLPLVLAQHSPSFGSMDGFRSVPRRTVLFNNSKNVRLFREEGVWNYSTMLLREDLGLLVLGAGEHIYALDINDISIKKSSVSWKVTPQQKEDCMNKGKDMIACLNYIKVLHSMEDGRMYVCGTNAFQPGCDYMSFKDGHLTLEKKTEDGKGKCPFDPFQRYSSVMIGDDLYSATSINFLGSEPVVSRRSPTSLRTEFKTTWLNEPTFISMAEIPESKSSSCGDDDKVYLFFSETAVEFDSFSKMLVSRVARVCKGDLGGLRTLQRRWTSFLKARVDCPVLASQLPYVIQDTYRWCDDANWRTCVFYAVFTPQSERSDISAVCAYSVLDIGRVFSEGKYKTPVTIETSFVKWVMYNGDVPSPRPGACIDDKARSHGITRSLDLPDQTLQFVKDHPLMDEAVKPKGLGPLLVYWGAAFTRIIVHSTTALDGKKHHIMFIGTENGSVLKAVNYDKENFIIEEVQLFNSPEPIKILRFSNTTGQLYVGSEYGVVQMPFSSCGRSISCEDCVLARDPYCAWDIHKAQCIALSTAKRNSDLIQSLWAGNFSQCPTAEPVKLVNSTTFVGGSLKLPCPLPSNLAETHWQHDTQPLQPSAHLHVLPDSLHIVTVSSSDSGHYRCVSLERSPSGTHTSTVAEYQLEVGPAPDGQPRRPEARTDGSSLAALQVAVACLSVLLAVLLGWNLYKGHLSLPGPCGRARNSGGARENQGAPAEVASVGHLVASQHGEGAKLLGAGEGNCTSNNNVCGGKVEGRGDEEGESEARYALHSVKYNH
ncbi:hypothetical protein UPYG_G00294940 [Umbra pygmaea]|uniref:Uncharacterized protein n=1 Tax=Umbra pygmaea TaxID=75934 RepID=A0ABD0W5W1_UMBPY